MNTGQLLQVGDTTHKTVSCSFCNKQFNEIHQAESHIVDILLTGNSDNFCLLLYKSIKLDCLFKAWEMELQEHLLLQNDNIQPQLKLNLPAINKVVLLHCRGTQFTFLTL